MGPSLLSSLKRNSDRTILFKKGMDRFCKFQSPIKRRLLHHRQSRSSGASAYSATTTMSMSTMPMNLVTVDDFTEKAMQVEVEHLLTMRTGGHPSVGALAVALSESKSVMFHHTNSSSSSSDPDNGTKNETASTLAETSNAFLLQLNRLSLNNEHEQIGMSLNQRHNLRTKQLQRALYTLEVRVGSSSEQVTSWQQAKEDVLATVLVFPNTTPPTPPPATNDATTSRSSSHTDRTRTTTTTSTNVTSGSTVAAAAAIATTMGNETNSNRAMQRWMKTKHSETDVDKYMQRIQDATRKQFSIIKDASYSKWQQVAKTTLPTTKQHDASSGAAPASSQPPELVDVVNRLDAAQQARLLEAYAIRDTRWKNQSVHDFEQRLRREELAAEAAEKASSLLRSLTPEEQEIVEDAIYGQGPDGDIMAQVDADSVQRGSMTRLQPGEWLNDEVIHYFMAMLSKRDEQLSNQSSSGCNRKRSHFFKSFFMEKLLDEGNANASKAGKYDYKNVKRWSKKVPGKDIFALDKIIFPVNVGGVHWVCVVAYMQQKRIQMYDSMGSTGRGYLESVFKYLQDEHKAKKGDSLVDLEEWKLVESTRDTPSQRNGYDCGVFTCMFADFLSTDCPLLFSQEHITQCRERIALSIMNGSAII